MALKNSLYRPEHKERSQLSRRAKYGLLEKHKDYVQRARDYHSKQKRLHRLRQKAADRNKDEFYFAMTHERTQGGVHVKRREDTSMPVDFVKVLKTQDENYIRTMRAAGLKKIEKLKAQLTALADIAAPHLGNGEEELNEDGLDELRKAGIIQSGKGKTRSKARRAKNHIIFVDNDEEVRKYAESPSPIQSSHPEQAEQSKGDDDVLDLGWKLPQHKKNRKRRSTDKEKEMTETEQADASDRREEAKKHRTRLLKELLARLQRDTQLRYAMRELEMQRLLMGKGGRRKLRGVERVDKGDDELDEDELDSMKKSERLRRKEAAKTYKPRVYKWRAERKK